LEPQDESSPWLPRKLRDGGKWSRRIKKHHQWSNAQMIALQKSCTKDKVILYILYQVVDEFDYDKIKSAKASKEA